MKNIFKLIPAIFKKRKSKKHLKGSGLYMIIDGRKKLLGYVDSIEIVEDFFPGKNPRVLNY